MRAWLPNACAKLGLVRLEPKFQEFIETYFRGGVLIVPNVKVAIFPNII